MNCDSAREAISARIDGEEEATAAAALDAHLASCPGCRAWEQRAHAATRRVRLTGAFLDHDLTPLVLAAVPARKAWWRPRLAQRGALLAIALVQLLIAAPLLVLGHDPEAGAHAAHELGSFDLALAAAFAVGALRPRLSAGLVWPCAIASAGLVVTALADLFRGQAIGADEVQHLAAVAGAAVLAWQARTVPGAGASPAGQVSAAGDGAPAPARDGAPPGAGDRPLPPGDPAARVPVAVAAGRAADHREGATVPASSDGRDESVA